LTILSAILIIFIFNLIFYRTELGREFRATSDDPVTAGLMGIRTGNVQAIAMGMALVIVTVGAFYLGMRSSFDPSIGPARLTYAFEAVIIGGLGSIWGTFIGGLIIGIAQTVGAAIDPEWQIMAGHLAFLVILLFRPNGLFPRLGG
jgi:branched-chain amino acid transport system permease protein